MRGARVPVQHLRARVGIIPAYAGSTACAATSGTRVWDHPRVCGEHTTKETMSNWELGSSPRMRGAPGGSLSSLILIGIIPAYAGSTRLRAMPAGARRDHPRVCGEHRCFLYPLVPRRGSSPRMRGAQFSEIPLLPVRGIIPAYAGSTRPRAPAAWSLGDHPRVCGEHILLALIILSLMGSSPRMRGARHNQRWRHPHAGIIPAYAGSTFTVYQKTAA